LKSTRRYDDPTATDWDVRVAQWEEVARTPAFQQMAAAIVERANPVRDDVVVDLGAGTGLLTMRFAPLVAEVIAVDSAPEMLERLRAKAAEAGCRNLQTVEADLRSLPLADGSVTLAVSNYAFHHLDDLGKELALSEVRRVLAPSGQLVICDMMFSLSLDARDRRLIAGKVWSMARRGPAGVVRLIRNASRVAGGRWERPATAERWQQMLLARHFVEIEIELLEHEGGIACARRPALGGGALAAQGSGAGHEQPLRSRDRFG
jgi:SAM-dependent methyltransferase